LAAFQAPADRELLLDQTTALPAAAGLAVRVDTRSGWCDSRPLGSVLTATRCALAPRPDRSRRRWAKPSGSPGW